MNKSIIALAIFSVLGVTHAVAYETGDMVFRAGLTHVAPDESSSNVNVGGTDLGVGVSVDSNTQLGLNFAYFLNSNWAIEVLAATPFQHDITLDTVGPLGETKHLPPTISANYHFMDSDSLFQPYVALGINYTLFFDEAFTTENESAGFSDLDMDESLGWSAQVGFDYLLGQKWLVNASVRYIDIQSTAKFKLNGVSGFVDVDIDPYVYSLTLGFRF